MRRFKEILYFADGATAPCPAFERAVTLARGNGAGLTLFDVVPKRQRGSDVEGRLGVDIEEVVRADREKALGRLAASLDDSDLSVDRRVVSGIPFVEVIRAVVTEGYDLVVKTATPADTFARRALGSTDLHLLRKCPCPIWIDRPDAASPYRIILAAVDPEDCGYEDSARLIMDLSTSLAQREGAELAVVHAWYLEGESVLRGGGAGLADADVELLLEETRQQRRERLDALLDPYGLTTDDPGVHFVKGNPAPSIRALSSELGADLVVMGTLGRRGIPGYFIGSTAEDVLQTTQASVLAIKPYGFVSPVTFD